MQRAVCIRQFAHQLERVLENPCGLHRPKASRGGIRHKFMKDLRTRQLSPRTRRVVKLLGVIGTVARGVIIALVGVLVIDAAVTYKSAKSGGVDKALLTLRDQPYGVALMILAAIGLIIFGIYGLCEARWRKV